MSNFNKTSITNDEIDLSEIVKILLKDRILILIVTSMFALTSVYYSLSLPNIYKSTSTLTIVDGASSNPNNLAQYSGLAAMAGVALPSASGSNKKYLAIETIKSRDFFKQLLNNDEVLPGLTAYKYYDVDKKKIIWNEEKFSTLTNEWLIDKPSFLEAYSIYIDSINIEENLKSGFITVSVKHVSPEFALELLNLIINQVNTISRERDLKESNESLVYLYKALETSQQSDLKKSINVLIETQLKTQMFANIKEEYLLRKLDKPYLPEKKSSPSRARICIMGTILGLFLSCIISLLRYFLYSKEYSKA